MVNNRETKQHPITELPIKWIDYMPGDKNHIIVMYNGSPYQLSVKVWQKLDNYKKKSSFLFEEYNFTASESNKFLDQYCYIDTKYAGIWGIVAISWHPNRISGKYFEATFRLPSQKDQEVILNDFTDLRQTVKWLIRFAVSDILIITPTNLVTIENEQENTNFGI